jgi:mono/diheme cytochrome c family protein
MFTKVVNALELVAAATAAVFVVLLFAYRPAHARPAYRGPLRAAPAGAAIYANNCAACHGDRGQGAIGPRLAGQVVARFPSQGDEIAVVTNGEDGMPAWGGRLSPTEIKAVVDYTRAGL